MTVKQQLKIISAKSFICFWLSYAVFLPVKSSFEPFIWLDLVLERYQSFLFHKIVFYFKTKQQTSKHTKQNNRNNKTTKTKTNKTNNTNNKQQQRQQQHSHTNNNNNNTTTTTITKLCTLILVKW